MASATGDNVTHYIGRLQDLSVSKLQAYYNRGTTVHSVVQAHLSRIAKLDPDLHTVINMNESAVEAALALDAERERDGNTRGRLFGVPILVSENIYVDDDLLEAAAGSSVLQSVWPPFEATAVEALRAAGAVILGTTNCSEWANFRSSPSDNGWSARGGQTFGAYHYRQDPSGSSSGSAVAVDMGFCVAALGTETSGSIIFPASQNNVVGIRPTLGLVSRRGMVPLSPEQDTIGVLARNFTDAMYVLDAISGLDDEDEKTHVFPFPDIPSSNIHVAPHAPPVRLGVPWHAFAKMNSNVLKAFEHEFVRPFKRLQLAEFVDCSFPALEFFESRSPEQLSDYIAGEFHHALIRHFDDAIAAFKPWNFLWGLVCDYTSRWEMEEYGEEEDDGPLQSMGTFGVNPPSDVASVPLWGRHTEWHGPRGYRRGPRPLPGLTNIQPNQMGSLRPKRNMKRLRQAMNTTKQSESYHISRFYAKWFAGQGGIQRALDGIAFGGGQPTGINERINDHQPVDYLVVPSGCYAANYFSAAGGYPQVSLPLGYHEAGTPIEYNATGRLISQGPNIPFGVSLIGRHFDEGRYLSRLCIFLDMTMDIREHVDDRRPGFLKG